MGGGDCLGGCHEYRSQEATSFDEMNHALCESIAHAIDLVATHGGTQRLHRGAFGMSHGRRVSRSATPFRPSGAFLGVEARSRAILSCYAARFTRLVVPRSARVT